MSPPDDLGHLRERLAAGRAEHLEAEDRTAKARWALAEADAGLAEALRVGRRRRDRAGDRATAYRRASATSRP